MACTSVCFDYSIFSMDFRYIIVRDSFRKYCSVDAISTGDTVILDVASQQEGHGFNSGPVDSLCGVCKFSL